MHNHQCNPLAGVVFEIDGMVQDSQVPAMTDAQLLQLIEVGIGLAFGFALLTRGLLKRKHERICPLCRGAGKSKDGIRCVICARKGILK